MAAIGHLSSETDTPAWIDAHTANASAEQVISCQNGLLDLDDRTLHEHSPSLFNLVHVPFAYDPNAPEPTAWLDFLHLSPLRRRETGSRAHTPAGAQPPQRRSRRCRTT